MRNAINKDFFREIKYTLNRYVSILLIVALGVAFLAGIRATCPDMKLTLDHYLDEADYMDLRVLSTLGLTGEDLTAIAEVDGVKEVDGAHSYDAFVMNGNEKWTLRFLSEPVSVNKLEITEGRDIENTNECVVDHLLIEKDGYHIGDQITVVPPGLSLIHISPEPFLSILRREKIYFPLYCGGRGTCGKCRIRITEGSLPITTEDRQFFSEDELKAGYRLGCRAVITASCAITFEEIQREDGFYVPSVQHAESLVREPIQRQNTAEAYGVKSNKDSRMPDKVSLSIAVDILSLIHI